MSTIACFLQGHAGNSSSQVSQKRQERTLLYQMNILKYRTKRIVIGFKTFNNSFIFFNFFLQFRAKLRVKTIARCRWALSHFLEGSLSVSTKLHQAQARVQNFFSSISSELTSPSFIKSQSQATPGHTITNVSVSSMTLKMCLVFH